MKSDRERWNEKHAAASDDELREPDPFVVEALDHLASIGVAAGRALDLACGRGRHALELARRGWRTTAWDVSPVALAEVEARARAEGLSVATRAVDVRADEPPVEPFDLIVVVNFLDRALLDRLDARVRPAGHLLITTFTTERPGTRPPLDYCLRPGELAQRYGDRALVAVERAGRAGVLAGV